MDELIVLGLVVAVWWLPALRVIRDMDEIPGIPRPLFWSVLPVIGLPIIALTRHLPEFGILVV